MSDFDTRITPALHPNTIKSLDGYTDETKPYVALVETAFSEAYEGVRSIWTAKEAAARNPTLNEAAKLIQVDDLANRKMDRITRAMDGAAGKLEQGISFLEGELAVPLRSKASENIAKEIREHIKSLPSEKRHAFIQEYINKGDELTVSAALGAPAYLSGLDDKFQQVYIRFWNERASPEKAARLKVMLAAREKLGRDAGKVFTAVADAVGYITDPKTQRKIYAAELRKQKQAAEQPFAS